MAPPFVWELRPEVFANLPLPRWYSLIFAAGFALGYVIFRSLARREGRPVELLDSLLLYVVTGTIVGMRLAHCLLYEPSYYLAHPLQIPMTWKGGYASHGGFAGVIIALALFARKHREMTFSWLLDRIAIVAILGAAFIRVGNFFNSEMIGRPANGLPWAVVFANIDQVPRHPAQLYEAAGYLAIFGLAWVLYRRTEISAHPGQLVGTVIVLGFAWRFFCEFFKEIQVGFEAEMVLNMGQLLSVPFVIAGVLLALGLPIRAIMTRASGMVQKPLTVALVFFVVASLKPSRAYEAAKARITPPAQTK